LRIRFSNSDVELLSGFDQTIFGSLRTSLILKGLILNIRQANQEPVRKK
jgi:hypothetical protein